MGSRWLASAPMEITTKKGDDGTTGLFYGGRVAKDSVQPRAYGAVDEAQAFIGLARAESAAGSDLDAMLSAVAKDLYVVMAELATLPENHHKLVDGVSRPTSAMVDALEAFTDDVGSRFEAPTEFVIPGQDRVAALLDVARTVVRRAERHAVTAAVPGSQVVPYLNRLSDLLWAMARWQEGESVVAREASGTVD